MEALFFSAALVCPIGLNGGSTPTRFSTTQGAPVPLRQPPSATTPSQAAAVPPFRDPVHRASIADELGLPCGNYPPPSLWLRNLVALREQAIEMSGAYTAVNWLGQFSQSYPLADLADYSLPGPVGNQPYAQDFFTLSRALLGAQSILTPVSCE